MLKGASNATGSRSSVPPPRTDADLAIATHLDSSTTGPGDRTAHEQEIAIGHHIDDRQAALGDPAAAHATRAADPLEHPRRRRRGADRTGRTDVVRAMGLRAALEVVALDRPLKALAFGQG